MLQTRWPLRTTVNRPGFKRWREPRILLADLLLFLGTAALVLPTMIEVARFNWSTEQGGHGPLVLASGLWLVWRELKETAPVAKMGSLIIGIPLLLSSLTIFILARITGILEIEAFAMYGAIISGAYLLVGPGVMRSIWFPLVYLAFALPPPDTVVAAVTQPMKILISSTAVSLLHGFGLPIASSGVTIQIGQYQLLVAAACAGLNSIITLSALCIFYMYLRHGANIAAFVLVCAAVIPIAVFANFVRVVTLILITYYFGDAAGQGFIHEAAGLLLFVVSLATIFAIDRAVWPLIRSKTQKSAG
ncbi:MAG TPA: exosortase V [Acidobacteriaceae bacterium]|nr:exosortase V [Acidobacteriaceae bacterium]